jgi:hypothetical protein
VFAIYSAMLATPNDESRAAALMKARERVPGSLLKFSDLWMSNFVVYLARFAAAAGVSVDAATDASDVNSASMNVAADDSDAEVASEGARLSLLSPIVLGPARSQPDDQATLATPLRPKRKRIDATRSEPTEMTLEKPSSNLRSAAAFASPTAGQVPCAVA